MFRKRNHRQIPELNTTSTADISFMLLIFFLVTSSMDTDKGLMRQMAPPPLEHEQPMDVQKDLVMRVAIDADNQLLCDDEVVTSQQLAEKVIALASVNREEHVISIEGERSRGLREPGRGGLCDPGRGLRRPVLATLSRSGGSSRA